MSTAYGVLLTGAGGGGSLEGGMILLIRRYVARLP